MEAQSTIRHLLDEYLKKMQVINPQYSLRAFAKKLEVSPSSLSEILKGKRNISVKMARKLLEKIHASPRVADETLGLFYNQYAQIRIPKNLKNLNAEQFELISEWYHFAILSLAETADFEFDEAWIAKRLNIKKREVRTALKRLQKLSLISFEKHKLNLTGNSLRTIDEVVNAALQSAHYSSLELARKSLDEDPITQRDFNNMTMAIDPNKIPEAKKLIRNFKEALCQFLESGEKKEVYQFCMQLFPLTRRSK